MNILIKKEESHVQIMDNDNQKILFVCSLNSTASPNYTDFKTIDITDNNGVDVFKLSFDNSSIYTQPNPSSAASLYSGDIEGLVRELNEVFFLDSNAQILEELTKESHIYQELKTAPSNYNLTDFLDLSFAVVSGNVDVTIKGVTINYPINAFGNKILGAEYNKDNYAHNVTFDGTGIILITYTKDN